MTTEQCQKSLFLIFLVIRCNQAFGIGQILGSQSTLSFYQPFNQRTKHLKQLLVAFRYRTRNNQRSTRIINQYRVYLIDDGIIMFTLYQVFGAGSHIITQVVETELVIGTERDIGHVCTTTCSRVRLMLVDTIYAQTMEHIERAHPFRVTFSQIIVHGYYMNTVTGQCVQKYRQSSYQCLTFTGRHFGNLTLMQHYATE